MQIFFIMRASSRRIRALSGKMLANPFDRVEGETSYSSSSFRTGLFVGHDTARSGQDHKSDLTRREQLCDPLLQLGELDVETGRNDSTFVQTSVQLYDNFP